MDSRSLVLQQLASDAWSRAKNRYPARELERIEVSLAVAGGRARPPDAGPGRALHQHLYVPGLTARPIWDAAHFPVAGRLAERFPLIRAEALALMGQPGAFDRDPGVVNTGDVHAPTSPLRGVWLGYYLQRNFWRRPEAAARAPITQRALDGVPLAREAMLSFLGPGSIIDVHSDLVNFVVTVYLPLFSTPGAWIQFADQVQPWIEGRCFAADSTFYHYSVNRTPWWRGVLIVDVWHPELTPVECAVLGDVAPRLDEVLRGKG